MREAGVVGLVHAGRGEHAHLLAGQLCFGTEPATLRTLLGSCVGITLWHPARRWGAMCHFLLPERPAGAPTGAPDARYGTEAMGVLLRAIEHAGTHPTDCHAGLYGGADTMPGAGVRLNVGQRNIEAGWRLLEQHGFQLQQVDVGDHVPRTIKLHLADGRVDLKRGAPHAAAPSPGRPTGPKATTP